MATTATSTRPVDVVTNPAHHPRSIAVAERLALRIGMALVIWSRRTHRPRPVVEVSSRFAHELARREREAAWQRAASEHGRWR